MTETKTIVDGWELIKWKRAPARQPIATAYNRGDIFDLSSRKDGECLESEWRKVEKVWCPLLRVGQEEVTREQEEAWVVRNFERMRNLRIHTTVPIQAGKTLHAGVALGRKKTWRERVGWWLIQKLVPEAFVFSPVLKAWAQGRL